MKMPKILLTLSLFTLASCASSGPKLGSGMGMNPHKPALDNTLVINKRDGLFRVGPIKGANAAIVKMLDGDLMNCNSTTFSMPRGHTVASFMREIFENELATAKKLSMSGEGIQPTIKVLEVNTANIEKGTWRVVIDYTENDKTTNVETLTTFDSKVSLLTSCTNTANVFEEAIADNFVEYFRRANRK